MLRFLVGCVLLYWLWSVYLEVEGLRLAVERLTGTPMIVQTPWEILREWLREQLLSVAMPVSN